MEEAGMIHLGAADRPLLDTGFCDQAERSTTLPSRWYRDPEVFALEKERIFFRSWWYVGAEAEVRDPGRYMTASVIDQDIFVIRSEDGVLRGFYNVCRHRAHRLLDGTGCRRRITCPYHAWTYGNDGRFLRARGVERVVDFDPQATGLTPVRVETMLGLVFVNLDPDARALAEVSEDMQADMRAHCPDLDRLLLAKRYEKQTAANWKALVDNNLESYHVAPAHPALTKLLDYRSFKVWEYELTTCHSMANTNPQNAAYDVGDNAAVRTAIYTWLWPNTAFFITPGRRNLAVFQMVPTGPETSTQCWDFFFEDQTLDENEQASLDYAIETLIPEDTALYENVQRGLRSRGYQAGRLVINRDRPEWSEHHVHMFQKLVHDALIPGRGAGPD